MFDRRLLDYIGDISQIGGIKRYEFVSGKAKGLEALDVNNGNGLNFTVLVDKGLDICNLSYKNIPVAFISKTGIVSPYFYNERDYEILRGFTGGFLTTCGLTQVGEPCEFEGGHYGLHGYYSNTPAEDVIICQEWEGNAFQMKISGKVRQAKLLHEDMVLSRTISAELGLDRISITDRVKNLSSSITPLMILYHMNFGYPLLNTESEIILPTINITGWDEHARNVADTYLDIKEPDSSMPESTFYHEMACGNDGTTGFMITNHKSNPDIGVSVRYNKRTLRNFTQWKYLGKKDYVMGMEPCNNLVQGLKHESDNGTLEYLNPGEERVIRLDISFMSLKEEILCEKEFYNSLLEQSISF